MEMHRCSFCDLFWTKSYHPLDDIRGSANIDSNKYINTLDSNKPIVELVNIGIAIAMNV